MTSAGMHVDKKTALSPDLGTRRGICWIEDKSLLDMAANLTTMLVGHS